MTGLVMYDAVNLAMFPPDTSAAAGYVNGRFPTFPLLKRMFPHAFLLSIAVSADADAECLDVENLDATPGQAPGWVTRQRARKIHRPVVYCSVSGAMDVLGHLARAGITRDQVRLWTAHYTFQAHICGPGTCAFPRLTATADGTQWTNRAFGLDLDESLLAAGFFGHPPVPSAYAEDNDMHAAIIPGSPVAVTRWAGAASQSLPPFFTVENFVLVGDTGTVVQAQFLADGKVLARKDFPLTTGEHVVVLPQAGTKTLRFARTDTSTALTAAIDIFRR